MVTMAASRRMLSRPLTLRTLAERGYLCWPTSWLLGLAAFALYNTAYGFAWLLRRLARLLARGAGRRIAW